MQKRAFLPFLMQLCQSVWLGFVSCWKPAAGKPAQREKASYFIYLFIYFLFPYLKGSSSCIPVSTTVREEKPPRNVSDTQTHTWTQTHTRTPAAAVAGEAALRLPAHAGQREPAGCGTRDGDPGAPP